MTEASEKRDEQYLLKAGEAVSKNIKVLNTKFGHQWFPMVQKALSNKDINTVKFCIDRFVYFLGINEQERNSLSPSFLALLELWEMDGDQYPKVYKSALHH